MKTNKCKYRKAHKDCERISFAFIFARVVSKNLKTPKLSPMADDAITWGGIGGLGSPVYICGPNSEVPHQSLHFHFVSICCRDEVEVVLDKCFVGKYMLIKFLCPRKESAGRIGIVGIKTYGYNRQSSPIDVIELVRL